MADELRYIATNWVNDETLLNETNMNHIEQGILNATNAINNKQDKIEYIVAQSPQGTFSQDDLEKLSILTNKIVYNNIVYCFSIREGNIRKYFATAVQTSNSMYKEIDVNMLTGEYSMINPIDYYLQQHIMNTDVHVTLAEKTFWNNKVTAYAEGIVEDEDYNLVLTKD